MANCWWFILQNGILRFAGFDVLKPQVYFGIGHSSDDYKDLIVERFKERLERIWKEKPLKFIPTERFREKRGFVLSGRSLAELDEAGKLSIAHYTESQSAAMAVIVEPETKLNAAKIADNIWHI